MEVVTVAEGAGPDGDAAPEACGSAPTDLFFAGSLHGIAPSSLAVDASLFYWTNAGEVVRLPRR